MGTPATEESIQKLMALVDARTPATEASVQKLIAKVDGLKLTIQEENKKSRILDALHRLEQFANVDVYDSNGKLETGGRDILRNILLSFATENGYAIDQYSVSADNNDEEGKQKFREMIVEQIFVLTLEKPNVKQDGNGRWWIWEGKRLLHDFTDL
mmetsp:Transcript_20066/g.32404  ORF Transcript_20066/g.32404 Transcript_20066/m.32404 type:complete len:156 (-) Transcript_20066:183-650(-)